MLSLILGIVLGARSCSSPGGKAKRVGYLSDITIEAPANGNYLAGSKIKPSAAYDKVSPGKEQLYAEPDNSKNSYNNSYKTNTTVGYSSSVIGTVERNIPKRTRDEGLGVYPMYGATLSSVIGGDEKAVAARNALITESSYLTAAGTWNGGGGGYTWMDKDGYLYSGSTAEPVKVLDKSGHHRRLYKHTTAIGLYGGNVSDSEPGIIKSVTVRPRGYNSYSVTGVYAPAGEVITIRISEQDMNATGGITIHIGQALYNGKANNIWAAKNQMQRTPILLNTMSVNKTTSVYDEATKTYTAYVGSFIGGPLYIRNTGAQFTATISGGVAYRHFILGYTTEDEYASYASCSAPYFDLEVWNYGVLHSGPARQAAGLTYDDCYKAAVLWDKVASVSTTNSQQGIVLLYDPFVAAGAAVAFPGQQSVNCPEGWMRNSLNYNSLVTAGAWGNFHEYHHNFQGYGVGGGGEVTNNGMTLVSYAEFTKISANRGATNFGGQGLSGWNLYTSAPWALEQTLKIARDGENPDNGKQGLALYATLLHNFGSDNYIKAKVTQQRTSAYGENYEGYLRAWQDVTHYDMTYFFNDILKGIDDAKAKAISAENAEKGYPMFVPVASTYQTGRSYTFDGQRKYFTTMQPYVILAGEPFTVDLRKYTQEGGQYRYGSVIVPDGFDFEIKNVAPLNGTLNGTIAPTGEAGVYTFTPTLGSKRSGAIVVTIGLTKRDGGFAVADAELIIEFEQSSEPTKMTLKRTTYSYDGNVYESATAAYENGFDGYSSVETINHSNPTQNCNTDIWYYADTPENHQKYPNAPAWYFIKENTVAVVEGKLYVEEEGTYRMFLRGRHNCAMYYSLDGGKTYTLGATITDGTSAYFRPDDANTYVDLENLPAKSWVYFKEVLICETKGGSVSYIGLGFKQWAQPLFTVVEKHYDKNGKEVEGPDAAGYDHTKTVYYDELGIEVDEDTVNNATIQAPKITNNTQPYVNAYRATYEFPDNDTFETDYFYRRSYNYNYQDNVQLGVGKQRVVEEQCANLKLSGNYGGNDLSVVVDGIKDSGGKLQLHTNDNGRPNADNPFTMVIDLGDVYTANRFVLYSQGGRSDPQFPAAMNLYASLDGYKYDLIGNFSNLTFSGNMQTINFQNTQMRYYKMEITETLRNFVIIRELEMWNICEVNGGTVCAPDDDMFAYSGSWSEVQEYSTYGHVYVGKSNATVSFSFTGTRIGIVSSAVYGKNFEVYIDGQKVESMSLKADSAAYLMTYLCNALDKKEHTVTIKCLGEASIDSIVVFP